MTIKFKIKAIHELTLNVDEKQFAEVLSYRRATKAMNGIMKVIAELHMGGFCNINHKDVYIPGFGTPDVLGIKVAYESIDTVKFEKVQP